MGKFRKKPVEIEAWRYEYEGLPMPKWLVAAMETGAVSISGPDGAHLVIRTLEDGPNGEAKHVADKGDWIIQGVKGELYPCKPGIFEATYEAVQ